MATSVLHFNISVTFSGMILNALSSILKEAESSRAGTFFPMGFSERGVCEEMMTEPGFACLSAALRGTRKGEVDLQTVAWYQDALIPKLEQSRKQLGKIVVPASLTAGVSPTVRSAELLFDRLQNVLEHVEDFLHDECGESLDKAISLLDVLQEQFGRVF